MTQYKSIIIPIPSDDTGVSYDVVAEAINLAITEQAKEGWEVALAQEMESNNNKGFFANLFGSKKKEKHTLLVFKKEEEKPAPEPAKEFDYDKFEEIVTKGMDYEKMANVMKKVVSETEVTISKKSFEGLKVSLPLPALPMNENDKPQPQATFLIGDKSAENALPDKENAGPSPDELGSDEKSLAVAKLLFDIFKKNEGKGITYKKILKECEGKLPEGATDADVGAILRALIDYNKVNKDGNLFSIKK